MNLMEDPVFKTKYHKYKVRVKLWESDFMEKYGRKPNKHDIKAADVTIRDAYKMYWKLKTRALDDTLTQITFYEKSTECDINDSISIESISQCSNQIEKDEQKLIHFESTNSDNYDENAALLKADDSLSSFQNQINVKETWSQYLNMEKNPSKKVQNISISDTSSFHLSQKALKNFTFSKRNPRKSASFSKSYSSDKILDASLKQVNEEQIKSSNDNSDANVLDCLSDKFKIIQNKNAKSKTTNTIQYLIENSTTTLHRSLDEKWLNRCVGDKNLPSILSDKSFSDNEDYVNNSDSDEERRNKRKRNLNEINTNELQECKRPCLSDNSNHFNKKDTYDTALQIPLTDENKTIIPKDTEKILNFKEYPYSNVYKFQKNDLEETENSDLCKNKKNIEKAEKSSDISDTNRRYNSTKNVQPKICTRNMKMSSISNSINDRQELEECTKKYFNKNEQNKKIREKNAVDQVPMCNVKSVDIMSSLPVNTGSNNLIKNFSKVLDSPKLQSQCLNSNSLTSESQDKEKNKMYKNMNDNYVKINLKKKVFARNKKSFNFSKFKKNQWKQRKKESSFTTSNSKKDENLKDNDSLTIHEDKSNFKFTLQEAEQMAGINKLENNFGSTTEQTYLQNFQSESDYNNSISSVHEMSKLTIENLSPIMTEVPPIYELETNGSVKDTPLEVLAALKKFGHNEFRTGQEKAIMRILSGQSTLVTLATGSGKSLCYQLPAYIYAKRSQCITLVVSPLVSLMDDQTSRIPNFLPSACLHTNQNPKLREKILNNLKEKKINILLVSPEAIVAGEKSNLFRNIFQELPPIAFACIDEVHCISQWSHNFRPSYLMVCKVLNEKLGIKRILGLTATASKSTSMSIAELIGIKDGLSGVVSERSLPCNLHLTISRDSEKDKALINLLCSEKFNKCNSIIIYCTRREECVRVSSLLRTSLKDFNTDNIGTKKSISTIAEAYHAGLTAHRRKLVQAAFMKSETRIIVATVAFGMGINKSDIRSVIHYNMPQNVESYVQEIGRAGRDGLPAYCHLFLNSEENSDKYELQRYINANSIDRHSIRRLLQKIFKPCNCSSKSHTRCPGHEVAFSIEETVKALDISEETIATLLCYLELHPKRFIKQLPPAYIIATVTSNSGPRVLKLAAQSSPPLAMAIALSMKKRIFSERSCTIEFPVIEIASAIGCESGMVKYQLKNLERTIGGGQQRSAISVSFDTLGFRIIAPGDLNNDELDEALETLSQQTQSYVLLRLQQLEFMYTTLRSFSFKTVKESIESENDSLLKSEKIKNIVYNYFESDNPSSNLFTPLQEIKLKNESQIVSDIRNLILSYKDNNFTGRSVARIFHGIQSPNYPALTWAKCRFWRAHLTEDFNLLCSLATQEILKMKSI